MERGFIIVTDASGVPSMEQATIGNTELVIFKLQYNPNQTQKLISGLNGVPGYTDLDLSDGTSPGYKVYFRIANPTTNSTPINIELEQHYTTDNGWYVFGEYTVHTDDYTPKMYAIASVVLVHLADTDGSEISLHEETIWQGSWRIFIAPRADSYDSGVEGVNFGPQGFQGIPGIQGAQGSGSGGGGGGAQGAQGWQGDRGSQGFQGAQGNAGSSGSNGTQGNQGLQGAQGLTGFQGSQGLQGAQGDRGFQGFQGGQGWQGAVGAQGNQGFQGAQGLTGLQGAQGVQGWQGLQGNQGRQGNQGPQGIIGPASATANFTIVDDGTTALSTGIKGDIRFGYACTIIAVTLLADQSGSIVVDLWKDTYANYPPVVGDSITASAKPTITTALKATDATLTGWTTSVSAGDIIRVNVDSATTVTRVTLSIDVSRP